MNQLIVFESTGKTIIGELVEKTDKALRVKNPAALFIQPNEKGQLNVQLFPMFFSELLSASKRDAGTTWSFDTAGIAVGEDIDFDAKLVSQYEKIFSTSKIVTPDSNVIKLFDS